MTPSRIIKEPYKDLTRAEKLGACVHKIVLGEGVPPFAHHAQELLRRSSNLEEDSSQLARVILKDVGLTSQLLRVSNSSLYNRSGRPIVSVAHAISLLGWDTVRNLVSSMRFVEHFAKESPGLRQLMMFSLLTATHGRQVASAVGYARPEEAYICGLLRNLGEVLVARYFGRDYADMLLTMQREKIAERAAAIRTFDFDLDEVSKRLAEVWNLPHCVRLSLDGGQTAVTPEERCLGSVTSYGHQLTNSLYRQSAPMENVHLKSLVNPQGKQCMISQRDLRRIVDSAIDDAQETFRVLMVPVASLRLEQQAEQARALLDGLEPRPAVRSMTNLDSTIEAARMEVEANAFEVGTLIQRVLDALTAEAGFARALFALMSEDRSVIRGRLGSGQGADEALRWFNFPVSRTDPAMTAAIHRKQDLWINRQTDQRFDRSKIVIASEPPHFALFPVVVDNVVAGAIYADRTQKQSQDELRPRLEKCRNIIATAIKKKRLAAGA